MKCMGKLRWFCAVFFVRSFVRFTFFVFSFMPFEAHVNCALIWVLKSYTVYVMNEIIYIYIRVQLIHYMNASSVWESIYIDRFLFFIIIILFVKVIYRRSVAGFWFFFYKKNNTQTPLQFTIHIWNLYTHSHNIYLYFCLMCVCV